MNKVEIAKNLLLNNTCGNCLWVINDNSISCCLKFPHIPEERTCELWESMKDAIRSIS